MDIDEVVLKRLISEWYDNGDNSWSDRESDAYYQCANQLEEVLTFTIEAVKATRKEADDGQ